MGSGDEGAAARPGGRHHARRRPRRLRGLRPRETSAAAHPGITDHARPVVEGDRSGPGAPVHRRHHRRPGHRPVRPPSHTGALRAGRGDRRPAGGAGRGRRGPGRPGRPLSRRALGAAPGRRPPPARRRRRRDRPGIGVAPPYPYAVEAERRWADPVDAPVGWSMRNRHLWRQDGGYRGWVEFFFDQQLPEPHSTKQYEDTVCWALDTDAEAMIAEREGRAAPAGGEAEELCRRVRCPVRVLHGSDDRCQPVARGRRLAELTGGDLVVLDGAGHLPHEPGPGEGDPADHRISSTRSRERRCMPRPGPAGLAARGAPCTCRRRSGSATPVATWPSPGS